MRFDRPRIGQSWSTVVGVAADVKNSGLAKEEIPEYYRLRRNLPGDWDLGGTWAKYRSSKFAPARSDFPLDSLASCRADPTLPVDIATLQQRVSKFADQPRFQTFLVGFFAATGLVLALIGLYGVISFLVTQRTQEIGVRMALVQSRGDVLRLVMGKSLRLIVWGTGVGLLAALALSRVLSSLLFGIGTHDPATFVVVTLLLVFVALMATLLRPGRLAGEPYRGFAL